MAKLTLTAKALAGLKPGPKRADYFDSGLSGFHVRVTPTGVKTFSVLYRHAGRLRRLSIGTYPPWTLADAREAATEALRAASKGKDPAAEKKRDRAAETFGELADAYVERWAKPRKKSWREDERIIKANLLPRFKHTRAKDLARADVRVMLEEIADGAPIMANRVLACGRRIYSWAITQDIVEANPFAGLPRPAPETRRDRVLSETEIKAVWKAIDAEPVELGGLFALRLITAQRGAEVSTMRWADVDGQWWTIPAERSKNKLPHRVWLSTSAVEILARIRAVRQASKNPRRRESPYVFQNRLRPEEPIHELQKVFQRIRAAAGVDFTAHDLRRTAASLMTGMGISRLVVGKILNHAEPGVTAVYDRHAYDSEKQAALKRWADRLEEIITGKPAAKVVSIG
jgi:integrase